MHPGLRDVRVWLGWFGPASRPLQAMSAATALATKLPGVRARDRRRRPGRLVEGLDGRTGRRDARAGALADRRRSRPTPTARRWRPCACEGVNPYDFTAGMLAWGAMRAADGGLLGSGALGPVDAFGLDELERGAAQAGVQRSDETT